MKPVMFLLNDRWAVKPDRTTSSLMLASLRRGNPVYITDVVHLQASSSTELFAEVLVLNPDADLDSTRKIANRIAKAKNIRVKFESLEAIFIRTTPGKDIARSWAHRLALEVMRLANEAGVRVLNSPLGLQKASSKLYTVCLPEKYVPKTTVCHALKSVQLFAEEINGPFVMKPLLGSQGRDVFFLDGPHALNTRQVVDILGRTGYLVVQEYVPEAVDGDIRVLTLDKELVSPDHPMGIRRSPGKGEWRSNVSLGGTVSVAELTPSQVKMCRQVARYLARDGIRFSGIDLVGEKIVEVNVFSAGGLQEYDRHLGRDVSLEVLNQLLN